MRTVNQFGNLDEMRNLLIKVDNNVPVRLKDIADVRQGYKEREGIVRVDGHEAIELAIYKEGDANTVSVAEAVRKTSSTSSSDSADATRSSTRSTTSRSSSRARSTTCATTRIIGGVLAVLIIFFFLADSWSTFIISLSLPISLIATFFFMGQAGVSLNVMSLGGLALATGMVVDDSIVVLENIARLREHGFGIVEAAVKGAREVSMAVIASTLTTVAVFFPLVFVQGVAGQLFRDQALTVTFAMLISLVVAMTLIPMLASLKGRSPIAYKDEEPSPGWQPSSKARPRREARRLRRCRRRFFQLDSDAIIASADFLRVQPHRPRRRQGVARDRPRRADAVQRARRAHITRFLPKALARPYAVLGFAAARIRRQHAADPDARHGSDPVSSRKAASR